MSRRGAGRHGTRLRVLVTSRQPLRLRAQRVFRLSPLAVPDEEGNVATLEEAPATALFLTVARAQTPASRSRPAMRARS